MKASKGQAGTQGTHLHSHGLRRLAGAAPRHSRCRHLAALPLLHPLGRLSCVPWRHMHSAEGGQHKGCKKVRAPKNVKSPALRPALAWAWPQGSSGAAMSALFDFRSFLTVLLLAICSCTYAKMLSPQARQRAVLTRHACLRLTPSTCTHAARCSHSARGLWASSGRWPGASLSVYNHRHRVALSTSLVA